MNKTILLLLSTLASPAAFAHPDQCDYSVAYNIEVTEKNLSFNHQNMASVTFYRDRLLVDGKPLILSERQMQASRDFDQLVRRMVPKVVDIAIDGAELGVKAATIVVSSLFEDDPQAFEDLVKPIAKIADKIKFNINSKNINTQSINATLDHELEQEIEKLTEKAVSKYAGKVIAQVFDSVFSSKDDASDSFSQRMDKMEKDLDQYVDTESRAIEKKAQALCGDLRQLAKLDETLESNKGFPESGLIQ